VLLPGSGEDGDVDRTRRGLVDRGGQQVREPGRQSHVDRRRSAWRGRLPLQGGDVAGGGGDVDEGDAFTRDGGDQVGVLAVGLPAGDDPRVVRAVG
jgi:hypothetical protein